MPLRNKRLRKSSDERTRDPNWQHGETILLLEEINSEKRVLLSTVCEGITNRRKEEAWDRIADKITTEFGVARRTSVKCREKWSVLKAAVIKQKKHETGAGGYPPKPLLHPDVVEAVMAIVGDNSAVVNEVQEPAAVDATNSVVDRSHSTFADGGSDNDRIGWRIKEDFSQEDDNDGGTDNDPLGCGIMVGLTQEDDDDGVTAPCKCKRLQQRQSAKAINRTMLYSKAQRPRHSIHSASTPRSNGTAVEEEEDYLLFQEYLRSEIKKNEKKSIYLEKMAEKASLEIILLKQQVTHRNDILVQGLGCQPQCENSAEVDL